MREWDTVYICESGIEEELHFDGVCALYDRLYWVARYIKHRVVICLHPTMDKFSRQVRNDLNDLQSRPITFCPVEHISTILRHDELCFCKP